jgi:hypothetical protein
VLELEYRLPPAYFEGKGFRRTSLHPPVFRGSTLVSHTRWQVTLPPGHVGAVVGRYVTLDYHWGWLGWLLAPRAVAGPVEMQPKESVEAPEQDISLAFEHGGSLAPQVYHLPRLAWFLACSGVLLVVALVLIFIPMPRLLLGLFLGALGLTLLVVALLAPALLPPLAYGAEPGVVALIVASIVQWLRAERYRRQVTFMPGFSRSSNSGLSRNSSQRRKREPSTVDAPTGPVLHAPAPPTSRSG